MTISNGDYVSAPTPEAAQGAIQRVVHTESLPMLSAPGPQAPPESHKPALVNVLWRRKWIVLAALIVSLAGGTAYALLATPIYVGSSRLWVQQSGPKIMATDAAGGSQSGNYLNTECMVIQSGPILADALRVVGDLRTFAGDPSPLSTLSKGLKAAPGKNDDLITVSFESPYADDAAAVVNAVVEAYKDNQSTSKKDTAEAVLKILEPERGKTEDQLKGARDALLAYKQKHPELGFQGEKGNIIIQRLDRLSTAVTEAEVQLADAKSAYMAVASMKDDPAKLQEFFEAKRAMSGAYVASQDEVHQLHSELDSLRVQLQVLRDTYPGKHADVERLETRIKEVEKLISDRETRAAQSMLEAIKQNYDAATKKLESVKAAYDEQMQEALGLNKVLADYERLQADCEQFSKLGEVLDGRIKELKVTQNAGALNISVLERAGKPGKPSKPIMAMVFGIAGAFGLLLGTGLAMLLNWRDPRVSSVEEVSALLGVPVVGVLPRIKGRLDIVRLGQNVLDVSNSPVAEAFRGIRTALHFGLQGARAKTVLVTSPSPGDGKSTLVSNLAITMSQAGLRTLVIDADLRNPHQHVIFGTSNEVGLADVLAGKSTLEEAIHSGGDERPDVLPAGRVNSHTSELFHERAFVELIRNVGESYDKVLIDSPPLQAVTDPIILAAICDGTILVLRAERSNRKMAEQAREGLASVGARVFGAVVNDVKGSGARYGHYRYYGYHASKTADSTDRTEKAPPPEKT